MKFGSDLLLEVLEREGVRYIFGNPGTTEMPIMHSLRRHPDLRYVLGLQEAAVVAMADGFAKASGETAFVNLHTVGGLGHAMGALQHSAIAKTPMLVTAGQQDTRHGFMDPLLYGDVLKMAEPAVKWSREVQHPDQIPALIRRGLQDSRTPPRGPIFLSLPIDILTAEARIDAGLGSAIDRGSSAGGLEELARALAAVEVGRLAIVSGDEVAVSDAAYQVVEIAEMLGCRVLGPSWPGSMSFPTDHPLWSGNLPSSADGMRAALGEYDAVFVVGEDPFLSYLYTPGGAVPHGCKLFQLSEDATQIGRTYAAALGCVGYLKPSLAALSALLIEAAAPLRDAARSLYQLAAAARVNALRDLDSRLMSESRQTSITPFVAAGSTLKAVGPAIAVVDEAPATMHHMRSFMTRFAVRKYFFMRSAILGWGLPAAVGVSLGLGSQPVVALLGDGSALYTPQGLWTAAKLKLPVTFVIMNNSEYNILKRYSVAQGYEHEGNSTIPGMELIDPTIDFGALATAFGLSACKVTRVEEIEEAIRAGIHSGSPNLVELVITRE